MQSSRKADTTPKITASIQSFGQKSIANNPFGSLVIYKVCYKTRIFQFFFAQISAKKAREHYGISSDRLCCVTVFENSFHQCFKTGMAFANLNKKCKKKHFQFCSDEIVAKTQPEKTKIFRQNII